MIFESTYSCSLKMERVVFDSPVDQGTWNFVTENLLQRRAAIQR